MSKVCAVVITYNRRELLDECLQAITAQTYPCDHIVVVDNASTDGTAEMVKERWAGRSDLHVLTKNIGAAGGYNLGMRVVAEGIEEVSQLALLLAANCDCGQGYLFSRPMPAEAVPDFLSRWQQEGPALLAAAGSPAHAMVRMQP